GPVTLTGPGADITTKAVSAAGPFTAAAGNVRLNVTGNALFGGPLTTGNLTQVNGAGTTAFKAPVTLTGTADLATGTVTADSAFTAKTGDVVLRLTGDATFAGELTAQNLLQFGGRTTTFFK